MNITAAQLVKTWGLNPAFAEKIAVFYHALETNGLSPRITSGWRDPVKQDLLRAKWDSGDRAGLRARPAADSLHVLHDNGRPDAKAIDIVSNNETRAAEIATALDIGAGLYFKKSDPGHYFDKMGRAAKIAAGGGAAAALLLLGFSIFLLWRRNS